MMGGCGWMYQWACLVGCSIQCVPIVCILLLNSVYSSLCLVVVLLLCCCCHVVVLLLSCVVVVLLCVLYCRCWSKEGS